MSQLRKYKANKTQKKMPDKKLTVSVLRKRQDFLRIAAARKKWVSGSMIVQMAPRPIQIEASDQAKSETGSKIISDMRVGYTASKKVGNAVMRNRAKRRFREVARQILPEQGTKGHDYVLIARTASLDMAFDQLIRDFNWCLKRLSPVADQIRHGPDPSQEGEKPASPTPRGGKE